jgi:hypothetical protein
VTQKMLHYGLSGLPLNIDDELVNQFRKGSKAIVLKEETLSRIKSDFIKSVDDLERDLTQTSSRSSDLTERVITLN